MNNKGQRVVHLQLVQLEGFYLEWNKGLLGGEGYRNGNRVLEHFWGGVIPSACSLGKVWLFLQLWSL